MKFLIAVVIVIVVLVALTWVRKNFSKEIRRAKSIRRANNDDQ
jgi:hypothetical protein